MRDDLEIFGREDMKYHLREQILTDKVSHAYIFCGEPGTGKKTVARRFAKTLLCETVENELEEGILDDNANIIPCQKCDSCTKVMTDTNPDLIWISKEPGKKNISVEDIRESLIEDIVKQPYRSKYKVYIIKGAQDLSVEAQSAMLKTLEEPPEYAVIILLSTTEKLLLPTIRSRSEIIEIPVLSNDIVKKYLTENYLGHEGITEEDIGFATAFADGKIGRGLAVLENPDFRELSRDVLDVVLNVKDMNLQDMIQRIKRVMLYDDFETDYFFELLTFWYRDVLMFMTTRDGNDILFKDNISDISKQSQFISFEGIDEIMQVIDKAKNRIRANVNVETAMEMMLLGIQEQLKG